MLRGKVGKIHNPIDSFQLESVQLYESCTDGMDFETATVDEDTSGTLEIELLQFNIAPTLELEGNIVTLKINSKNISSTGGTIELNFDIEPSKCLSDNLSGAEFSSSNLTY